KSQPSVWIRLDFGTVVIAPSGLSTAACCPPPENWFMIKQAVILQCLSLVTIDPAGRSIDWWLASLRNCLSSHTACTTASLSLVLSVLQGFSIERIFSPV